MAAVERKAAIVQVKIPAVFMRGGTSKGMFFRREWLPQDPAAWPSIFLAALGSPDPYGRQLDGLGGGISSLSKVVVVDRSSRSDSDIEYTFGQVAIGEPAVAFRTNCGNLTAAVGPFAVDEGMIAPVGDGAVVRLYNTNTGKRVTARFPLDDGRAAVEGDFALPGVAGRGARIRLEFQDPGGAVTGHLLPTGQPGERLALPGHGDVEASLVDATTAVVFVRADALGAGGAESPEALEANQLLLEQLEAVRAAAAVRMGIAATMEEASLRSPSSPIVALVAPPRRARTLTGEWLEAEAMDVTARMLSMGRPHRALPLTGAMCLAVAARIEGTVVHAVVRPGETPSRDLRIAHPSGVMPLAAAVRQADGWTADEVVAYRTARRLMEGSVLVPASRLGPLVAGA